MKHTKKTKKEIELLFLFRFFRVFRGYIFFDNRICKIEYVGEMFDNRGFDRPPIRFRIPKAFPSKSRVRLRRR